MQQTRKSVFSVRCIKYLSGLFLKMYAEYTKKTFVYIVDVQY